MGLVRLAQSERTVLEAEIGSYRAEAEKQRKVRASRGVTFRVYDRFQGLSYAPGFKLGRSVTWWHRRYGLRAQASLITPQGILLLDLRRSAQAWASIWIPLPRKRMNAIPIAAQAIIQLEAERDRYAGEAAAAQAAHSAATEEANAKEVRSITENTAPWALNSSS